MGMSPACHLPAIRRNKNMNQKKKKKRKGKEEEMTRPTLDRHRMPQEGDSSARMERHVSTFDLSQDLDAAWRQASSSSSS